MLVLDTDHLSNFERGSAGATALRARLAAAGDDVVATIISAEEQLRGWLARIHATKAVHDQFAAYAKLQERLAFYAKWRLLPWTPGAADRFVALRKSGVRIGTMDLKIAGPQDRRDRAGARRHVAVAELGRFRESAGDSRGVLALRTELAGDIAPQALR